MSSEQNVFRREAKRVQKHYRMGAISKGLMRVNLIDCYVTAFKKYPRKMMQKKG
jgi:hypothetical protein